MTIRRFFQVVWALFFVLVLAIGVVAALLYVNEENLTTSQRVRFESYMLADELRQSSDDLTRFVRSYVVTGDPKYRKFYWDVLAIRNGVKPRPLHYNRIYWDFVAAGLPVRWPATEAVSLQARMSRLGFTDAEFHKLNEAQRYSNALVKRENAAINAMEGLYDDGTGRFRKRGRPDQALAVRLVHDAEYQREKARVMKPIDDFFAMLDARTASTMDQYAKRGFRYLELIIGMLLALLVLTVVSSVMIAHRVTAPVALLEKQTEKVAADIDSLAAVAERIAQGNLSETFETTTRPLEIRSNDEIGQLSRMQTHMIERLQEAGESIAKITAELREDAVKLEARNREFHESYTQLRKLESLRDSLTHMIVHDMRTPVTSMYGYLQTLQAHEADTLTDEGREYLAIVMSETQNLIEMISSLLDVSKMEHGEMQLDVSDFDLVGAVREVLARLEPLREQRTITLDVPDAPVRVCADAHLISRVIQNLLSNALKFTREDGRIGVRVEPGEREVRVCVSDDGPGVPEEYRERIFEKFGQVESRAKQQKYSTGLGLTFCKLAVESHGGRIGLDSEIDKGSTFWFTLPVGGPC